VIGHDYNIFSNWGAKIQIFGKIPKPSKKVIADFSKLQRKLKYTHPLTPPCSQGGGGALVISISLKGLPG
jgi:hypothetical protein